MCTTSIKGIASSTQFCNLNGLHVKPYFIKQAPFLICTAKIQNIFHLSKKRPQKSITEEQIFFFLVYKANDIYIFGKLICQF